MSQNEDRWTDPEAYTDEELDCIMARFEEYGDYLDRRLGTTGRKPEKPQKPDRSAAVLADLKNIIKACADTYGAREKLLGPIMRTDDHSQVMCKAAIMAMHDTYAGLLETIESLERKHERDRRS